MTTNSNKLCTTIVDAIGEVEETDPSELGYSIYEYIDPVVLDALENRPENEWELEFRVNDHLIRVDSVGTFTVDGQEYSWSAQ